MLAFLVARDGDGAPAACGALAGPRRQAWPRSSACTCAPSSAGAASRGRVLEALEREALRRGFDRIRLETGERQPEAMGLYRSAGYEEIEKYGPYRDAPLSRCFERRLR